MSRLALMMCVGLAVPPTAAQTSDLLSGDLERAATRERADASPTTEADRLAHQAGAALRRGEHERGVALLDKASAVAFQSGATGHAFELSLAAAEARRSRGDLVDAAERFRHAALRNARDPRAAAAHYLACELMEKATDDETDESWLAYEAMLAQHAATWPKRPTAARARWDRVELLARRGYWAGLISACRAVPPDSDHYQRSRRLLVNAHAVTLTDRGGEAFTALRADLEPIVLGASWSWPTEWTPLQRAAALALARAHLGRGDSETADAEKYARVALRGRPEPHAAWRRSAVSLLTVVALSRGDTAEADEWISAAYRGEAMDRRRLLRSAAGWIAGDDQRATLLTASDRLAKAMVAVDAARASADAPTTPAHAAALRDAGRLADATDAYARLAAQRPNNRSVQVAYAELLAESDDPQHHEEALGIWRTIESRSAKSSEQWFEARLARLRLMTKTGRTAEARKLLALTKLLAPSLGGEALRKEFDALARELE